VASETLASIVQRAAVFQPAAFRYTVERCRLARSRWADWDQRVASPVNDHTMPMTIATCRFDGPLPEKAALTEAIVAKLGRANASEVELELEGSLVHVYAMDPVVVVYAQRACVELGGTPCDRSGNLCDRPWPAWVAEPWFKLG